MSNYEDFFLFFINCIDLIFFVIINKSDGEKNSNEKRHLSLNADFKKLNSANVKMSADKDGVVHCRLISLLLLVLMARLLSPLTPPSLLTRLHCRT